MSPNYLLMYSEQLATDIELLCQNLKAPSNTLFQIRKSSSSVYANIHERIIQAKTHVVQIKFMDALREVIKNKYFWIISLAGWLGFLEGACFNILNWLYSYQHACTAGQYAFITTIYGNASLWGMLLAPVLIKKIGKRNTLIAINSLNIVFLGAIYPIVKVCRHEHYDLACSYLPLDECPCRCFRTYSFTKYQRRYP